MRWGWLLVAVVVFTRAGVAFSDSNASSVSVTIVTPQCGDGVDNDGDGLVDYPTDPGCSSSADNDETDPINCPGDGPSKCVECNDGVDNDSDGKIDYPADLGCDSLTDNTEAGEITPNTVPPSSSTGSGGNGPLNIQNLPTGQVIFEGVAKTGDKIEALVNGARHPGLIVGVDGKFSLLVQGVESGVHLFVLYLVTPQGDVTKPQTFAVNVPSGLITYIRGINFMSEESREVREACGVTGVCKGDLNTDKKVDLLDFSIASYWWQRPLEGDFINVEKNTLNGDGKITIEDFSILAYYWTGA